MNSSPENEPPVPPPDTLEMFECLTRAVRDTLETKRRLGHYAVFWRDGRTVAEGDDAPDDLRVNADISPSMNGEEAEPIDDVWSARRGDGTRKPRCHWRMPERILPSCLGSWCSTVA